MVNWYCAALLRPPTRRSWMACRIERGAGDARQLGAQPRDDVIGRDLALRQRLQRDEHAALIGGRRRRRRRRR